MGDAGRSWAPIAVWLKKAGLGYSDWSECLITADDLYL